MLLHSKRFSISRADDEITVILMEDKHLSVDEKQAYLFVNKLVNLIAKLIQDDFLTNENTIFCSNVAYCSAIIDTEDYSIKNLVLEVSVKEDVTDEELSDEIGYLFSCENIYINYIINELELIRLDTIMKIK